MVRLICMSFDGAYVTEGEFETIGDAWERASNMGSRWFFYPFHFVVSESGKTIIAAPVNYLDWTVGRHVKTVSRIFEKVASAPENQNMGPDEFILALA